MMTYNRMFALFSEHSPENLKLLSDELLRPMAHLMIDEFQDVSPQIVSWIRASLNEIRSRGPAMHVGRGRSVRRYCVLAMTGSRFTVGAAARRVTSWSSIRNFLHRAPQE